MYHNDVGIVKSRGFLSGRKSNTGFEKYVQNASLLSLWFLPSQARLETKVLKCSVKACSFRLTELYRKYYSAGKKFCINPGIKSLAWVPGHIYRY